MRFVLSGFVGANKQVQPRLLAEDVGVESFNQNPTRGDLRAWKQPLAVATVPSGRKTIYRMGRDVVSDALYWFSWIGTVHAVRGFIASDTTERTYYTGDGAPKVADNTISLASAPYPTTARDLGVPKPALPVSLAQASAGTGTDELRFYVQTYVTDRGEESAPSTTASITVKPGAIINITNLQLPPAGNYGITARRIYRTQAATSSAAEFFFLIEVAVASVSTQDDARALGADVLATTGWETPPTNLKQLTGMWNGIMAGISGRSVRYCEPYKPYAWPVAYETLPPDVTPVALGVWSKNLLILTTGRPYLVNGSSPDSLGDDPIEFDQACVSDRSVVDVGHGVVWASPDGLAYYGAGGARMLTAGLMNREDWQAIVPGSITGGQYEGAYLGCYEVGGVLKGFLIDPVNPKGIYFLNLGYSALWFDKLQDALYVLEGTSIKKWDAGAAFMTAVFKSKPFRSPRPINMGYVEVIADTYPVTVKVYASGALTETRSVPSQDPVTLKAGFLATDWQFEVTPSAGGVQGVAIAQSIDELKQV